MSTQASSDLIWRVVKSGNAFTRKQRFGRGSERLVLSSEVRNAPNTHSFKHSGIAHQGANLQLAANGDVQVLAKEKEPVTLSVNKAIAAAKVAGEGRSDLRTSLRAKASRLRRLATRKSRKSWAAINKEE